MKVFLQTHQSQEWGEANLLYVELSAEAARRIIAQRDQCGAFLKQMGERYCGHVDLSADIPISAGMYSFEEIPDGSYEKELDDDGWTDVTRFMGDENVDWDLEERIECVTLRFYGCVPCVYIEAMGKHSGNHIEGELFDEILQRALKEETNVTTTVTQ